MGRDAGKVRIRSRRECGNGVRNPFGKDGAPAGARTLDPLIKSLIFWRFLLRSCTLIWLILIGYLSIDVMNIFSFLLR